MWIRYITRTRNRIAKEEKTLRVQKDSLSLFQTLVQPNLPGIIHC